MLWKNAWEIVHGFLGIFILRVTLLASVIFSFEKKEWGRKWEEEGAVISKNIDNYVMRKLGERSWFVYWLLL